MTRPSNTHLSLTRATVSHVSILLVLATLVAGCDDDAQLGREPPAGSSDVDTTTTGDADDGWTSDDGDTGLTDDGDTDSSTGDADVGTGGEDDDAGELPDVAPFDPSVSLSNVEVGVPLPGVAQPTATALRLIPDAFGPTAPGTSPWAASSKHRATVHPIAIGAHASAVEIEIQDAAGLPVDDGTIAIRLLAFPSSAALPGSEVWSTSTSTLAIDGRVRIALSETDTSTLAWGDPLWLRVELDGEALAPVLRWGEVPMAVVAEGVPAAGVEPDVVLPQAALEATTRVVRWTVRPGDTLESIPDPNEWSCAWRVHDAAELRVERRDVQLSCCSGGPTGICGPGPTFVAYAETWVSGGVGVHENGGTDCNLAAAECAPVVWARIVPWAETPSVDEQCDFEGKPWKAGTPRLITGPNDPQAKDLLLSVDATCTRR